MMEDRAHIAGAIIAGGQSGRMHEGGVPGDKFLQILGAEPIIARIATCLKPQVSQLFINANGDPTRFAGLGLPVVPDMPLPQGGPLSGILTALDYAKDFSWLVTAAADTPFFPVDLVDALFDRQQQTKTAIVLASSAGRIHPVFGLWCTDLAPRLADWLSTAPKASVLAFAQHIGFETVDFPLIPTKDGVESYDPFFNINRPGDLAEAQRLNGMIK